MAVPIPGLIHSQFATSPYSSSPVGILVSLATIIVFIGIVAVVLKKRSS